MPGVVVFLGGISDCQFIFSDDCKNHTQMVTQVHTWDEELLVSKSYPFLPRYRICLLLWPWAIAK